ncbi:hypothetical protein KY285_011327 [Solanum tuberosum]|nr:hypothetical protein KY285_011327 [Solanum tuberosum]
MTAAKIKVKWRTYEQGRESRVTMTIINNIFIATQLRQREIQRDIIKNKKDKDKKWGKGSYWIQLSQITQYMAPLSIPSRNPLHPPGYNSTEKE